MSGTNASTETPKKQKALPTKLITSFVLPVEKSPPAAGLFVIFRGAPPPPDSDFAKIVAATAEPPPEENAATDTQAAPPPKPAEQPFALGKCDAAGVLGPVDMAEGPVLSDSYKLRGKYELFFVHHPSVEEARRWLDRINTERGDLVPHTLEVTDAAITVPTSPSDYLPAGSSRYGGWVLFANMPLAKLPSVQTAVTVLQADLGKLRYLVGNDSNPYLPQEPKGPNSTSGRTYEDGTVEPVGGEFSALTLAAVYAFQRDAIGGRLLRLAKPPVTTWDYLDTEPQPASVPAPPPQVDGVADAETAGAIADARGANLRKPGQILIEVAANKTGLRRWLREEAALAFAAWDALVMAMGAAGGVCFGWSHRSAYNCTLSADPGRAVFSLHKNGIAIDLETAGGFIPGSATFPVCIVHENDPADTFRLFIPSSEAVPSEAGRADASAALAARLEQAIDDARGDRKLSAVEPTARKLLARLHADPAGFWADYFHATVRPWTWQDTAYGGFAGPESKPQPPASRATGESWLDVTRVGEVAGLTRIHCGGAWKHSWSKAGTSGNLTKLLTMMATAKDQHDKEDAAHPPPPKPDPNLVGPALESHAAPSPPWEPARREVAITPAPDSYLAASSMSVPFKDIDRALLDKWNQALSSLKTKRVKAVGALLEVQLTARTECNVLENAIKVLGAFQQNRLVGKVKGELITESGRLWCSRLRDLQYELTEVPAKKTDGSRPSKAPNEADYVVRLALIVSKGPQQVFFDRSDTVLVPISTGGVARCQEWWHFQHAKLAGAGWWNNMADLGLTPELLCSDPVPNAHGRTGIGYKRP